MTYRTPLLFVVLAGCPASANLDTTDDPSQATTTAQAGDDSGTAQTGTTGPGDTTAASEQDPTVTGGSASASQSGSQTAADTGDPGTSSTGEAGTTSSTGTTGGASSTGECTPRADGPAPVQLGASDDLAAAGAYVVLAKTAITNVPGSVISGGNVGISPATHTGITGFALVVDPSGVFATSPEVAGPGKVYAADYTLPTPVNLTTAVLGMQAAYTDAAGRVPADFSDLESGAIGGQTLPPGVYNWGSSVLVAADVTLAGCEDDVWILQVAGDLDIAATRSVLLSGGAQAHNVFWQVAGAVTVHVDAHAEGVLLAKTDITLQTEASLTGRAYAQTMVVLDQNAITAP